MVNDVMTTGNQLSVRDSLSATLLEMRMDPKRFPRVGSVSRDEASREIAKIVTQAFLYKGHTSDPETIRFISCSLTDELQSDQYKLGTREISFAEIARVVKRSVLQDEMYGISVATLFKIIVTYIKGEGHNLHSEAMEAKRRQDQESLKRSIIAPMIDHYAKELVQNSKI